jgi:hypothetical protein
MLLTYSGGARLPTKHSLMPQPDRTARTQPRSQSLQEGALHSFTCSRICNFALTAAVGILKTHQQAYLATERVLIIGTVSTDPI